MPLQPAIHLIGQVQQIEAARAMVLLVLTKGPTGIVEYTSLGVEVKNYIYAYRFKSR